MIKIILTTTALFFSFVAIGQSFVTTVPNYCNDTEGAEVRSSEIVTEGSKLTVLYSASKGKNINCKQWDGTKWKRFGEFPSTYGRGKVYLSQNNGKYYALVWEGKGWNMFIKENSSSDWTILGNELFAASLDLNTPTISFNGDQLLISEYKNDALVIYAYKDGKIAKQTTINNQDISAIGSEYMYCSLDNKEALLGWIDTQSKEMKVFKTSNSTQPIDISKGLNKFAIHQVRNLAYLNGSYFVSYTNLRYELGLLKYNDAKEKWENVKLPETLNQYGSYFSEDLSFITSAKDTEKPMLFHFNGKNWDTGERLNGPERQIGEAMQLSKADDGYYLRYINTDKAPILLKITTP